MSDRGDMAPAEWISVRALCVLGVCAGHIQEEEQRDAEVAEQIGAAAASAGSSQASGLAPRQS